MTRLDKRFALRRGSTPWYAALIEERGTGASSYRVSEFGKTRDARGLAEKLADIETVACRVLKEGRRMRCAPEDGKPNSLGMVSGGVTGWRLDEAVAAKLGLPAEGSV